MSDKVPAPKKTSPEKSIRALPKLNLTEDEQDTSGESLQKYSDQEWQSSEEPYPSELLNVKKKPNRVTVFAAPIKKEQTRVSLKSPTSATEDRSHYIARLMQKVTNVLLENEDAKGVEVHVSMVFREEKPIPLTGKK
ncbi:unnamed protein product [Caenorhabditis auriculariae]|uniref:Uncharacterized protein n=1 Tax=Caenorhabditis auriculariae TaxID=2777116 RepID=A0A8S1H0M3_9PELO|nr:unnamed protein product [Caenorhabditis auriculariae]